MDYGTSYFATYNNGKISRRGQTGPGSIRLPQDWAEADEAMHKYAEDNDLDKLAIYVMYSDSSFNITEVHEENTLQKKEI